MIGEDMQSDAEIPEPTEIQVAVADLAGASGPVIQGLIVDLASARSALRAYQQTCAALRAQNSDLRQRLADSAED